MVRALLQNCLSYSHQKKVRHLLSLLKLHEVIINLVFDWKFPLLFFQRLVSISIVIEEQVCPIVSVHMCKSVYTSGVCLKCPFLAHFWPVTHKIGRGLTMVNRVLTIDQMKVPLKNKWSPQLTLERIFQLLAHRLHYYYYYHYHCYYYIGCFIYSIRW